MIFFCDGCDKKRRWLKNLGEISICFVCLKEQERGRLYDLNKGKYYSLAPEYFAG